VQKQRELSRKLHCVIVLKGAHTSITSPDGKVYFNSTGNPAMAKGGSGDVLTGIILGLLGQQYNPLDAAVMGVFLHGLAGDLAAEEKGQFGAIPTDFIHNIGHAFNVLMNEKSSS
jgi:NAD(P)H-hydrate epimerase